MIELKEHLEAALAYITARLSAPPEVAIILGTGLGRLVDKMADKQVLSYEDIPHFPVSTVEFHNGKLVFGNLSGKRVMVMQGRFHYYEGYTMQQIALPIRVMKALGVSALLVSNACGVMNPDFGKGELMLITDHINLFLDNPLIGPNDDEAGARFPDMSRPYSPEINGLFEAAANSLGIRLNKGVYSAVSGPNLETAAEYRYLQFIGADVVGMSTIPEVITANHAGLPVAAVSVITDVCDPDNLMPADINDILATAATAEIDLIRLFEEVLRRL
jgi:purine-nucleoside phosphorylase